MLPWDTEVFGFPVADWRPGDALTVARARDAVGEAIRHWAESKRAQVISARFPSADAVGRLVLSLLGFEFIDCSVAVEISDLQRAALPQGRYLVRPVQLEDHGGIVRIAEEAFQLDRYHADARFPRTLPERRHRLWMQDLLGSPATAAQTWTVGAPGQPEGLITAVFAPGQAEIQLAAVDVRRHGRGLGWSLFAGALRALKERGGVGRCISKQYASNTPMMNVFARVGFRFVDAQALFHWHSPGATGLRAPEEIFG